MLDKHKILNVSLGSETRRTFPQNPKLCWVSRDPMQTFYMRNNYINTVAHVESLVMEPRHHAVMYLLNVHWQAAMDKALQ